MTCNRWVDRVALRLSFASRQSSAASKRKRQAPPSVSPFSTTRDRHLFYHGLDPRSRDYVEWVRFNLLPAQGLRLSR
jgi:hypothetical protein